MILSVPSSKVLLLHNHVLDLTLCHGFGGVSTFPVDGQCRLSGALQYVSNCSFLKGTGDKVIQFVEMMATSMLVFTSGQIDATILSYQSNKIGAYVGISNIFLLSTFIYATAAPSGGHINPMITWTTFWCGLCPLSRGVLLS